MYEILGHLPYLTARLLHPVMTLIKYSLSRVSLLGAMDCLRILRVDTERLHSLILDFTGHTLLGILFHIVPPERTPYLDTITSRTHSKIRSIDFLMMGLKRAC